MKERTNQQSKLFWILITIIICLSLFFNKTVSYDKQQIKKQNINNGSAYERFDWD